MARSFDMLTVKGVRLPRVVALAGRKYSAKDLSAIALAGLGYRRTAFADDLKLLSAELIPGIELQAFSDHRKEMRIGHLSADLKMQPVTEITPRIVNQRIGNGARKVFGDNFWTDKVVERIRSSGLWVVTDCRFHHEIAAIQALGGYCIRLNRADRQDSHGFLDADADGGCGFCYNPELTSQPCGLLASSHPTSWTADRHLSETELPDSGDQYDAVIEADSAESAVEQVRAAVMRVGQ